MKRITVFGSGYVGLITSACFAGIGNDVVCVDTNAQRIARLQAGDVPLHEPGLGQILHSGQGAGRLHFTANPAEGVAHAELVFIAVGTPRREDGSADLGSVLEVAETIGETLAGDCIVVNKSTVPVGTSDRVEAVIRAGLARRSARHRVAVLSNPEFLKEGEAVRDFMEPDRIIIGGSDEEAIRCLLAVYAPLGLHPSRVIVMSARDAEFTKYAANAMLAARISLMNEFANIAERLDVDIEAVRLGIGSDRRVGNNFLHAGCGYGGSCFPKDVSALAYMARQSGYEPKMLGSVQAVNEEQKHRLFEKIFDWFEGSLDGRVFALWGMAFKPGTDDMREAPSCTLMELLWSAGASVQAHDPAAMDEARARFGARDDLVLAGNQYDALRGADALVIVTEWREYRQPRFSLLKRELRYPVIFDGRNVLDMKMASEAGIEIEAIGRPNGKLHSASAWRPWLGQS